MEKCLHIKNGRVIDPARNLDAVGDVFVLDGKIVKKLEAALLASAVVIDAAGCLVVPGLIDFHAHLFGGGTDAGIPPDLALLPYGVTTAVDGGSTGSANYESFYRSIVATSLVRVKTFLNIAPAGLTTGRHDEVLDPKVIDRDKTAQLFAQYPSNLIGLKVRQSRGVVGDLGLAPLEAAVKLADSLGCPVAVHSTDPPGSNDELLALLRPGDIFVHVYHGVGNTIIGGDGKVLPAVRSARQRGV
ncbi:MAG: amidohydrolase family protein [Negativicutes bacterium]|nr:amidohydrolase family protein [Negativicutes bacterium]